MRDNCHVGRPELATHNHMALDQLMDLRNDTMKIVYPFANVVTTRHPEPKPRPKPEPEPKPKPKPKPKPHPHATQVTKQADFKAALKEHAEKTARYSEITLTLTLSLSLILSLSLSLTQASMHLTKLEGHCVGPYLCGDVIQSADFHMFEMLDPNPDPHPHPHPHPNPNPNPNPHPRPNPNPNPNPNQVRDARPARGHVRAGDGRYRGV